MGFHELAGDLWILRPARNRFAVVLNCWHEAHFGSGGIHVDYFILASVRRQRGRQTSRFSHSGMDQFRRTWIHGVSRGKSTLQRVCTTHTGSFSWGVFSLFGVMLGINIFF